VKNRLPVAQLFQHGHQIGIRVRENSMVHAHSGILGGIDIYTWQRGKNLVSWVYAAEPL
jgi:hypothetical protein